MSGLVIKLIAASEIRRTLRLTLAIPGQSAAEVERQVSSFIEYAKTMRLDLGVQWQAFLDGRASSAISYVESPDRSAMIFLRDSRMPGVANTATDALLRHTIDAVSHKDVRLLQCLIAVNNDADRIALTQAGFLEIATIVYMERAISPAPPLPPTVLPSPTLAWSTYDPSCREVFSDLISATYQDSLDCPRLTGLRNMEDILVGHQSVGHFEPHRWLLLSRNNQSAACILLAENPLRPALELAYMGVHPDHRRRGLARLLVAQALHLTQKEGFSALTVAVDEANKPAFDLYTSFGFELTARRRAYVLPLPQA